MHNSIETLNVTAIMATCGRHYCAERSLALFLNQEYAAKHLLIYQNSDVPQELDSCVDASIVSLVNNHIDQTTNLPYTNLGAIYNDSIKFIPENTDVIIFWDDDDIFLEEHISEGVKGLIKGGKSAYKPAFSYFRHPNGFEKVQNALEPSIFVKASHIRKNGFSKSTTDQHLQWLKPLMITDDIFVDPDGEPTLIYNWGDTFYTYKTSANVSKPDHFFDYRINSYDHGDGIISPIDISDIL